MKQVPGSMRWAGPLGFLFTRAVVVRLRGKYQAEGSSTSLDKVGHVTPRFQSAWCQPHACWRATGWCLWMVPR